MGLGFRVDSRSYTNCMGFRSWRFDRLSGDFHGVSVLTFALYKLYLSELEGLGCRVKG